MGVIGKRVVLAVTAGAMVATLVTGTVSAWEPADGAFERTWQRTDKPVADGLIRRTWMWGPHAVTNPFQEEYTDAEDGKRLVQYFDKTRMEITNPGGDESSGWYVTNGLLAMELMTGRMQLGDDEFAQREPSQIPIAGDQNDPDSPTYETFGKLLDRASAEHDYLIERVDKDGNVSTDESLSRYGVPTSHRVTEAGIDHEIAYPFWYFMNADGMVYEDGELVSDLLFSNPFYATGYPVTEPYWVTVDVNGEEKDILVQAFERRVMTYDPLRIDGWNLEVGNIGRHYYEWRYGVAPEANVVVTTIETGEDTIEYRFGGNPPPDVLDSGPTAFSISPDGTFWVTDSAASRLSQFNTDGERINTIELADQYAQRLFDVDARGDLVWTWWANLDLGIYKIQAYEPGGTLVYDIDLDPTLIDDAMTSSVGITVADNGEVVMNMDLGFRLVRVVDSDGNADATPVDGFVIDGHEYRLEPSPEDLAKATIYVDDRPLEIIADEGSFALELGILPDPEGDSFFIKRNSVSDTATEELTWTVEHYTVDGKRLGYGTSPLGGSYVYMTSPYSVGPEGGLYVLMTYPDRLEVQRIGFATE